MPLDLKPELEESLSDESNAIWTTTELDNILELALAKINQVRQRQVRDTIDLVTDTDTYTLTNVYSAQRVDLLDSDSKMVMSLPIGSWEIWGDNNTSGQTLYINPTYAKTGYKIRVHGYGPYDFTTNTPDVITQSAILAEARAEALRRLMTDRARFRQWAQTNPRGDLSITEGLSLINESDVEARRLLNSIRMIKRPVPGRF